MTRTHNNEQIPVPNEAQVIKPLLQLVVCHVAPGETNGRTGAVGTAVPIKNAPRSRYAPSASAQRRLLPNPSDGLMKRTLTQQPRGLWTRRKKKEAGLEHADLCSVRTHSGTRARSRMNAQVRTFGAPGSPRGYIVVESIRRSKLKAANSKEGRTHKLGLVFLGSPVAIYRRSRWSSACPSCVSFFRVEEQESDLGGSA